MPREIYESSETQTEKDSIISTQIINESFSQNKSRDYSQAKEEIKHRIDRRNTIRNQIEILKKNKKNNRESPPKFLKILYQFYIIQFQTFGENFKFLETSLMEI